MLLIALLLGLGSYFWVRNGVVAEARATTVRQAAELSSIRSANRELLTTVERARQAMAAGETSVTASSEPGALTALGPVDRAARTRALLALIKGGQLGTITYAAPSVYKVSTKVDKLAEVLGLPAKDTARLNAAANQVAAELLAGARVAATGDQVTIEMEDSPQARAKFGQMRETFREVLGEDGHAVYEALGFQSALENSLNNLGLVGYSMTVTKVPGVDGKPLTYQYLREGTAQVAAMMSLTPGATRPPGTIAPVTDEEAAKATAARRQQQQQTVTSSASRGGFTPTGPTVPDRTTLESRIGPLSALLPAGF